MKMIRNPLSHILKKREKKALFFIASLLAHALLLHGPIPEMGKTPVNKSIQVEFLTIPKKSTRQIVKAPDKILNNEIPKESFFLSQRNQRVEKQTQSRGDSRSTPRQLHAPSKNQRAQHRSPKKSHRKKQVYTSSLNQLTPTFLPARDLRPQFRQNSPRTRASGTSKDFLKKLSQGPQTLLNTREFIYYSFYQRIREKIRPQWEPRVRQSLTQVVQKGRNLASSNDKTTQLIVTLNEQGEVVNVKVTRRSGLKELDNAAIEAFEAAQPFPNPPKGLVRGKAKTIQLRWNFILEA